MMYPKHSITRMLRDLGRSIAWLFNRNPVPSADPRAEAYKCNDPACGCDSSKHDLPPVRDPELVVMQAGHINEALEMVFGPWGTPKEVVSTGNSVLVKYREGYEIRFIPTQRSDK